MHGPSLMSHLLVLGTLLFSAASFAGNRMDCRNSATGAQIYIEHFPQANQTYYEMNDRLISKLGQQGVDVVGRGGGNATWNPSEFNFWDYKSELKVFSDYGGILLTYERVDRWSSAIQRAKFYFHPGECRFSVR